MIPPTPTPLPPGQVYFSISSAYSLWSNTDDAITTWNMLAPWHPVFQGLLIIGIVIIGMFIVWRFVQQMTRSDAEQ